jgi:hypothetical protein
MFAWLHTVFSSSSQQKLKVWLGKRPYAALVGVIFFVFGIVHQFVRLVLDHILISVLFACASAVVGGFIFALYARGELDCFKGSWLVRTCMELWTEKQEEE